MNCLWPLSLSIGLLFSVVLSGCSGNVVHSPQALSHDVWIVTDLQWQSAEGQPPGEAFAANGMLLFLDSTGYFKRLQHIYYRTANSDTVSISHTEGERIWVGAWQKCDNIVIVHSRCVRNDYRKVGESVPGPMLTDTIVFNISDSSWTLSYVGRTFQPWSALTPASWRLARQFEYPGAFRDALLGKSG